MKWMIAGNNSDVSRDAVFHQLQCHCWPVVPWTLDIQSSAMTGHAASNHLTIRVSNCWASHCFVEFWWLFLCKLVLVWLSNLDLLLHVLKCFDLDHSRWPVPSEERSKIRMLFYYACCPAGCLWTDLGISNIASKASLSFHVWVSFLK